MFNVGVLYALESMMKKIFAMLLLFGLIVMPTVVLASEADAFNPSGTVGATMFFLALILPFAAYYYFLGNRK